MIFPNCIQHVSTRFWKCFCDTSNQVVPPKSLLKLQVKVPHCLCGKKQTIIFHGQRFKHQPLGNLSKTVKKIDFGGHPEALTLVTTTANGVYSKCWRMTSPCKDNLKYDLCCSSACYASFWVNCDILPPFGGSWSSHMAVIHQEILQKPLSLIFNKKIMRKITGITADKVASTSKMLLTRSLWVDQVSWKKPTKF